jgi:hypothetical protein
MLIASGLAAVIVVAVPLPARAEAIELCRFDGEELAEISGLAYSALHDGIVWAHNDSGAAPNLYALDIETCEIRAVLKVKGITSRDPEAIASGLGTLGAPVLWWGDIGDNTGQRPYVEIHEIPEPVTLRSGEVDARTYRVRLGERQDAEALLADGDRLWVIGKGLLDGTVWKLPRLTRTDRVARARSVGVEGPLVTDAAMRPGGGYAVRDYSEVRIYSGLPPGELITRMPLPAQVQGEAMTWTPDGSSLIIASEGDDRLLLVPIDADAQVTPSTNPSVTAPATQSASSAQPSSEAPPAPVATSLESVDRLGNLAVIALAVGLGVFVVSMAAVPLIARWRARR